MNVHIYKVIISQKDLLITFPLQNKNLSKSHLLVNPIIWKHSGSSV